MVDAESKGKGKQTAEEELRASKGKGKMTEPADVDDDEEDEEDFDEDVSPKAAAMLDALCSMPSPHKLQHPLMTICWMAQLSCSGKHACVPSMHVFCA